MDQHKLICGSHKPILPMMPAEETTLKFDDWGNMQRHPFVIYADFEAFLVKCDEKKGMKTTVFQKHSAISYEIYVKTDNNLPRDMLCTRIQPTD